VEAFDVFNQFCKYFYVKEKESDKEPSIRKLYAFGLIKLLYDRYKNSYILGILDCIKKNDFNNDNFFVDEDKKEIIFLKFKIEKEESLLDIDKEIKDFYELDKQIEDYEFKKFIKSGYKVKKIFCVNLDYKDTDKDEYKYRYQYEDKYEEKKFYDISDLCDEIYKSKAKVGLSKFIEGIRLLSSMVEFLFKTNIYDYIIEDNNLKINGLYDFFGKLDSKGNSKGKNDFIKDFINQEYYLFENDYKYTEKEKYIKFILYYFDLIEMIEPFIIKEQEKENKNYKKSMKSYKITMDKCNESEIILENIDFSKINLEFIYTEDILGSNLKNIIFENCKFNKLKFKGDKVKKDKISLEFKSCIFYYTLSFTSVSKDNNNFDDLRFEDFEIRQSLIYCIEINNGKYKNFKIVESDFVDVEIQKQKYRLDVTGVVQIDNFEVIGREVKNNNTKIDKIVFGYKDDGSNVSNVNIENIKLENVEVGDKIDIKIGNGIFDKCSLELINFKSNHIDLNVLEKDTKKYKIETKKATEIGRIEINGYSKEFNKKSCLDADFEIKGDVDSKIRELCFNGLEFKKSLGIFYSKINFISFVNVKFWNLFFVNEVYKIYDESLVKNLGILDDVSNLLIDYNFMKIVNMDFDFSFLRKKDYKLDVDIKKLMYYRETLVDMYKYLANKGDLFLANEVRAKSFELHEKIMKVDNKIWLSKERIVYFFNKWLAGYGENIWMPIGWMFGFNLCFVFLMLGYNLWKELHNIKDLNLDFWYYVKYFLSNFVPPFTDNIIGVVEDKAYYDSRKKVNSSMWWNFPKLWSAFMWYLVYKCVRFRNGEK